MARIYRMSDDLRERLNQVWYSEKLGRTYSSEKRMRAAEAASERMKKNAIIDSIEKKLPIIWEELKSDRNDKDSYSHFEDSILHRIFYDYQGKWEELEAGSIKWYYKTYGMDNGDVTGKTLRTFIKDILPDDILTENEFKKINEFWGEM